MLFNRDTEKLIAKTNMRLYARLYRESLAFARGYRDYDPPVYERWCVRAGIHLAEAIRERNIKNTK